MDLLTLRKIKKLKAENRRLKKENVRLKRENKRLNVRYRKLEKERENKEVETDDRYVQQTTYLNFFIAYTNDYVRGYLVTSRKVTIEMLKEICRNILSERHPNKKISRFEVAYEEGIINYSRFVLFREDDEIDNIDIMI